MYWKNTEKFWENVANNSATKRYNNICDLRHWDRTKEIMSEGDIKILKECWDYAGTMLEILLNEILQMLTSFSMYIFCTTCIESANSALSAPWDKVLIRPRPCLYLLPAVRLLLYSVRHWLASDCGEINTYSKRPYCILQSNLVIVNFLISAKLFTTASLSTI